MRISEAIEKEKKRGSWYNGPTSVSVGFLNNEGNEDETELDVYGENGKSTETELEELWESLHEEMEANVDAILYVEAYGYINKD